MDLSVVIVTYNSRATIENCLIALQAGLNGLSYEIRLVDNFSHDGTVELIAEKFPGVLLIANRHNHGFGAGCNQAIRQCAGRNILLLNPDTVVQTAAIPALVHFLDDQAEAGLAGCAQLDESGRDALACYPELSLATIFWSHLQLNKLFPYTVQGIYRQAAEDRRHPPFEVSWVTGSCLMFKRAVYHDIGPLDENIFLFAEETDFCRRARLKGWQVWFLPGVVVTHLGGKSTEQLPYARLSNYYISKLYFFSKHYSKYKLYLLKGLFVIDLTLRFSIRKLQAATFRGSASKQSGMYIQILKQVVKYKPELHHTLIIKNF